MTATVSPAGVPARPSAWSPFGHRTFTVLWIATVVSNIGTWMHDVGAGWLMTSLSPSPLMVAFVQTATTLPIFLFALPAGALADIVDRRRLLLIVQIIMTALAGALALIVWLGRVDAITLLVFTFLLGACAAFVAPAWQAIVPKLVPKDALQPAIALNSVGINISRAIGPALAGFVIVGLGIAAPFALNALSFLCVIGALIWWRPAPTPRTDLPAEALWSGVVTGLRFAWSSTPLKATLIRAASFFISASAFWALLPLIAKNELKGTATLYGVMLGAAGAGAVTGALFMPMLRKRLSPDRMVTVATGLIALVMLAVATIRHPAVATAGCFVFGAGWIAVLSTLNVSAQIALPDWVRARGLSVYLTVFFGAMSAGSALWGQVATQATIPIALLAAAVLLVAAIPATRNAKLHQAEGLDLSPSMHWPAPIVAGDGVDDRAGERRPVMTTIEYRIAPESQAQFRALMVELGEARKRLGAYSWGVLEDAAVPGCFVEYFLETSWLQHLRHHERVSGADRKLQEQILTLHRGDGKPIVRHLVGPKM
ncbi:MFS transporter [Accumulibacter sp.]|jgi:MFS family permease|uniref:MFS transporter n=1 Tax=Accumulibacter sp. TaxID=2053492 RepID=UPI002617C99E|nr:MFS transporter [Accumulibacter sp.]